MEERPLPVEPERRRILMVLDEPSFTRLSYEKNGPALLYSDELHVVRLPLKQRGPLFEKLGAKALLHTGSVLLQSPFDPDDYEKIESAEEHFARLKLYHFTHLCQLLGARRVTVEQLEISSEKGTDVVQLDGAAPGVLATGKLKMEETQRLRRQFSMSTQFAGSSADVNAARSYLAQHRLSGDQIVASMVELAASANRVTSQRVHLHLSDETRRNIDAVTQLALPTFLTAMEARWRSAREHKREFSLRLQVDF